MSKTKIFAIALLSLTVLVSGCMDTTGEPATEDLESEPADDFEEPPTEDELDEETTQEGDLDPEENTEDSN